MAELLKGCKLIKKEGKEDKDVTPEEHLNGKVVALYFSAHWCPPCRAFTPVLKDFYEELEESDPGKLEIIFVSFDRQEADLKSYMEESHGEWCYFPFKDPQIQGLAEKFGVQGIPSLIVIDKAGNPVVSNGRGDVQGKKPQDTLKAWREASGITA